MLFWGPGGIVAGTWGTGSAKFYSSGNLGVKKWPAPQGTWSLGFHVTSLCTTNYQI